MGRLMRRMPLSAQAGVALVATLLAIFILTVVVAALALATMGETGLSFDQSRSGQAFHLAESGASRALGELRRRISVDLEASVRTADPLIVQGHCNANHGWRIIVDFGGPGWVDGEAVTPGTRRAYLDMGTAALPIAVRDARGNVLGLLHARIYVRPADNSNPPPASNICISTGFASYQMRFDYFIVATGMTRNARRTICLKNLGNQASCGEWLASPNPGAVTWDSPPPSHGWLILIEGTAYAAAPRWPRVQPDLLYDRPLWEELTGQ